MSVATYERLGPGLVPLGPLVEGLRAVKDDDELELLRTACAITDQAFADVLHTIRPGVTERDVARLLEARMIELGAAKPAFDTIVAAGPNGAIPHHAPPPTASCAPASWSPSTSAPPTRGTTPT
ncbi:M24 family metallopeptidase [Nonomuraea ferruginea]